MHKEREILFKGKKREMQRANGSVLAARKVGGYSWRWPRPGSPNSSVTTHPSCHLTVREPCLRTLHPNPAFLRRNHKGRRSLCVFCLVFVFILVFVFLVQHNLELLKAFQPKCGEKTGKAFFFPFCTKLAFLIVQMNLGPPTIWGSHPLPRIDLGFLSMA